MTEEATDTRQEFVERRAAGLGATDSPKILGLSRWGTPLTVYRDKTEPPEAAGQSLPAWLGLKLEATVAELYTAKTGTRLRADNRQHFSRDHDFIFAHLDYRARGDRSLLVECKTKAYERGFGPDGSTEIPADIWVQVQHEMYATEAREAHVAVLFGHHRFSVYPIQRDPEFIDKLRRRLVEFWERNVVPRVPPAPIGHYLDDKVIRSQFPDNDGTLKAATPEQEALVRQLQSTRLNATQVKAVQDELENKLKLVIGGADGLTGSFGKITFKRSKDGVAVDWEQVAVTYGNVIDELLLLANPGDDEQAVARLGRAQAVHETALGLATSPKPGSRRFLVFKEE